MTTIEKVDVTLPNAEDAGKLAFILLNVFTPEECEEWIKLTEERGYGPALVNIGFNQEVAMPDFRNSDRCIIDDTDMADKLFQRIKSYLPQTWKNHDILELNERLRFLRYDPGQKFGHHMGKNLHIYIYIFFFKSNSLLFSKYRWCLYTS